jgi:hypothetical protein
MIAEAEKVVKKIRKHQGGRFQLLAKKEPARLHPVQTLQVFLAADQGQVESPGLASWKRGRPDSKTISGTA